MLLPLMDLVNTTATILKLLARNIKFLHNFKKCQVAWIGTFVSTYVPALLQEWWDVSAADCKTWADTGLFWILLRNTGLTRENHSPDSAKPIVPSALLSPHRISWQRCYYWYEYYFKVYSAPFFFLTFQFLSIWLINIFKGSSNKQLKIQK